RVFSGYGDGKGFYVGQRNVFPCDEQGAAASAQGAAAVEQFILVRYFQSRCEAELGDGKLSLHGPLVERFHVFQLCIEVKIAAVDLFVDERVEDECVVRAGRKS